MMKKTHEPDKEDLDAAEKQLLDQQQKIDYDVKEYTVAFLVQQFKQKELFIPEYQRKFVWDEKRQSKFIESMLLGLPIPYLFAADVEEGRLEIIDGAQRIHSLQAFHDGSLSLTGLEELDLLNDFHYSSLPAAQRRKFDNRSLRMIVISGSAAQSVRFEIFERVNTGSVIANPMEVRKGAFAGPLQKLIEKLATDPLFEQLCPISADVRKRGEAAELVLRFLAYSDRYTQFRHSVRDFLDDYMREMRTQFDETEMVKRFSNVMSFVKKSFPHGFAKSASATTTPRVRFEAISVGVHLALKQKPRLIVQSMDWLDSDEFQRLTRSDASNSGPRLKARVEFVRDSLLGRR